MDDVISRQAEHYAQGFADGYKRGMKDADRPKGKWILTEDDITDTIRRQVTIEKVYHLPGCTLIFKHDHDGIGLITVEVMDMLMEMVKGKQPKIVMCKHCKHRHLDVDVMIWNCPFGLPGGEDFFCAYGAKDGDSDGE